MPDPNDLNARLDAMVRELKELDAKATPGKLNAHGPYLSVREDITRTIEHLDELGVGPSGRFQCVPFHRREDVALLAFLRNAVPDILAALQRLEEQKARVEGLRDILETIEEIANETDQQRTHSERCYEIRSYARAALSATPPPPETEVK